MQIEKLVKHIFNQCGYTQDRSFGKFLGFMTQADGREHWINPNEGRLKINVDATCFTYFNSFSLTFLARDDQSVAIEAFSSCRQGHMELEIAETIGIMEALIWVKIMKWKNVVLESDCLVVVHAIKCSTINLSYLDRVVEECRRLMSQLKHHNMVLDFVKRSVNKVTHELAR